MKIMMDIPDSLAREILNNAQQNDRTFEEEWKVLIRAGLEASAAPDVVYSLVDLRVQLAARVKALPAGTKFSVHDVTDGLAITPNIKKQLGRTLAKDACEENGYVRDGKTQQNLSQYLRK